MMLLVYTFPFEYFTANVCTQKGYTAINTNVRPEHMMALAILEPKISVIISPSAHTRLLCRIFRETHGSDIF